MRLNTLKPAPGARRARLRVGRGASAGQGKTCARGTKGQRARKGGYHKVGFRSDIKRTRAEVRLHELAKVEGAVVDLEALKKAVTLKGVAATKGARAAIEAAGGRIEERTPDKAG
ncbi:MAG TPA: 50S ribosomal protein L15 [Steroidobacteraceae bacterium]|nr:50S ribosomal protein L15 [Steroidobacteraceae bacterium]